MMVEPTEREAKDGLARFCEAMLAIREEIRAVEAGEPPREGNVLRNSPHTAKAVTALEWPHPNTRQQAAFPAEWTNARTFWSAVGRINNALSDRKLSSSCPPMASNRS